MLPKSQSFCSPENKIVIIPVAATDLFSFRASHRLHCSHRTRPSPTVLCIFTDTSSLAASCVFFLIGRHDSPICQYCGYAFVQRALAQNAIALRLVFLVLQAFLAAPAAVAELLNKCPFPSSSRRSSSACSFSDITLPLALLLSLFGLFCLSWSSPKMYLRKVPPRPSFHTTELS